MCIAGPSIGDPVPVVITQKGNGFKNVFRKIHQKIAGTMLDHTAVVFEDRIIIPVPKLVVIAGVNNSSAIIF